jgi:4-diphosphocytidyl-2-C-methyl-D-erythritol kinase
LRFGDLNGVCENLHNDFEEALGFEEIFEIKRRFEKFSSLAALMSGSGTAVFGIFAKKSDAKAYETAIKTIYDKIYLCKPKT